MQKQGFTFTIKVSRAYFIQNYQEYPVDIPYLKFEKDGNVTLDGEDDVGSFSFSGKTHGECVTLQKKYHGKHTVYYAGIIVKNELKLHYSLTNNYDFLMKCVAAQDFNAGIVFEADNYWLNKDGCSHQIFLSNDDEDSKKLKGLGMIDGKVRKFLLMKKSDSKGKIRIKFPVHKEVWPVTIDGYNINVAAETD